MTFLDLEDWEETWTVQALVTSATDVKWASPEHRISKDLLFSLVVDIWQVYENLFPHGVTSRFVAEPPNRLVIIARKGGITLSSEISLPRDQRPASPSTVIGSEP